MFARTVAAALLAAMCMCGWLCADETQPQPAPVEITLKETALSDVDPGMLSASLVASPDLSRVAYVARPAGQKSCYVMLDGKQGKICDAITSLTFSPDSKRFACIAKSGDKYLVVLDGAEQKAYDDVAGIVFSPDSKRISYKVRPANEDNWIVIADGAEGKRCSSVGALVFSPDSAHLAYSTWSDYGNKGGAMVVDGTPGKIYDGTLSDPVYSPDSKHIAYGVNLFSEKKQMVVLDGAEGKKYDSLCADIFGGAPERYLLFSPDSSRFAYLAKAEENWLVVLDGAEGQGYAQISPLSLTFSPDSKRFACTACGADTMGLIVMDGKESGDKLQEIGGDTLSFSPDSKRFAYSGSMRGLGGSGVVMIDGVKTAVYGSDGPVIFSPDSTRTAFHVLMGKTIFTVDGVRLATQYEDYSRGTLAFTPDSKHATFLAKADGKWKVVVDSAEAGDYESPVGAGRLIIDSPTHMRTMMIRGDKILLVEVDIAE